MDTNRCSVDFDCAWFRSVFGHDKLSDNIGELNCSGVNQNSVTGNPSLHGEIVAISCGLSMP